MRYCADTWFLLELFGRKIKALNLINDSQRGKDWIFVSFVTYTETMKKLFQQGIGEEKINTFFELLEGTNKLVFIPVDINIAREAAKISLSYRIPLVDAFVAATAKVVNCDILLATDTDFNLLAKKKYIKLQSW